MLRCILRHLINVGFKDMITVHVRHFGRIFEPNFVFCVLGEVVEGGDVEGEFAGFGEFAEADAQGS